jgi:RimJ/RimL family protein N-acetyltransferase
MEGTLTRLVPVADADFELITRWLQPSQVATMGAGGQADFRTLESIRTAMSKAPMVMIETKDGRKVGLVQWHTIHYPRSYELGAIVGDQELWDSGCGAEASLLALDYLFRFKDAHRVQLTVGLYNRRVLTFLAKTDVVIEGVFRDFFYFDGRFHDAVVASVLRHEYDKAVAEGDGLLLSTEMIPAEEKELAVKEFRAYLRQRWTRMLDDLVERD